MKPSSDTVRRILVEVIDDRQPEQPDTPEEAAARARLEAQVAEARAKGWAIEIPAEMP